MSAQHGINVSKCRKIEGAHTWAERELQIQALPLLRGHLRLHYKEVHSVLEVTEDRKKGSYARHPQAAREFEHKHEINKARLEQADSSIDQLSP